jgi:hypothetical protein
LIGSSVLQLPRGKYIYIYSLRFALPILSTKTDLWPPSVLRNVNTFH